MKKVFALILALAMVFSLVACGSKPADDGAVDEAKPVHWKVNTSISENAARFLKQVLDEISEESGGQFTYDLYYSSSLVQLTELTSALYNNVCQLALIPCSVVASQVVYNAEVLGYPFQGLTDNYQAWQLYTDMMEEFPEMEEELNALGIKSWSGYMNPGYNFIWNTDREVRTPQDLAGLKIQTTNVVLSNMMADLGAAPVNSGASDLFSNMEKAVVNGCHQNLSTANTFGVPQVTGSVTIFGEEYNQGIQYELQLLCMSLKAWNELPANIQELFTKHADQMAQLDCKRQSDGCFNFMENTSADCKVYNLTEDEIQVWKDTIAPYVDQNVQDLVDKGYTRIPEQREFVQKWIAENVA